MGKATDEKDTYETLSVKLKATREQMADIQQELDQLGRNKAEGVLVTFFQCSIF